MSLPDPRQPLHTSSVQAPGTILWPSLLLPQQRMLSARPDATLALRQGNNVTVVAGDELYLEAVQRLVAGIPWIFDGVPANSPEENPIRLKHRYAISRVGEFELELKKIDEIVMSDATPDNISQPTTDNIPSSSAVAHDDRIVDSDDDDDALPSITWSTNFELDGDNIFASCTFPTSPSCDYPQDQIMEHTNRLSSQLDQPAHRDTCDLQGAMATVTTKPTTQILQSPGNVPHWKRTSEPAKSKDDVLSALRNGQEIYLRPHDRLWMDAVTHFKDGSEWILDDIRDAKITDARHMRYTCKLTRTKASDFYAGGRVIVVQKTAEREIRLPTSDVRAAAIKTHTRK